MSRIHSARPTPGGQSLGTAPVAATTRAGTGLYATVRVIVSEVQRRRIDPTPLLAAHGLHPPRLWHPLERGPREAILNFVDACNAAAGDPGLHVAATLQAAIGAFEIADYLVVMAPTVGQSLQAVGERFDLVNDGIRLRFDDSQEVVRGTVDAIFEPHPHPIEAECTIVAIETRVRHATGGAHGLSHVTFSHADRGARAALVRAFQCPVSFGGGADEVSFSRAAWDSPSRFRQQSLDSVLTVVPPGPAQKEVPRVIVDVRRALCSGLATGDQQAPDVARRLGVSARTLQRRLTAAGYSLTDLLSEVRRDAAVRQLMDPDLSVGQISHDLGFSEPSAFARAFKRWTGLSPSEYRAAKNVATAEVPTDPRSEE